MISPQENEWLKRTLADCGDGMSTMRRQKSFSLLIRRFVKNMEDIVEEMQRVREQNPASKKEEEQLHVLKRNLFYLRRFCEEKIKERC